MLNHVIHYYKHNLGELNFRKIMINLWVIFCDFHIKILISIFIILKNMKRIIILNKSILIFEQSNYKVSL
jgi:hypothetical protein